jgi:hypothetical protein
MLGTLSSSSVPSHAWRPTPKNAAFFLKALVNAPCLASASLAATWPPVPAAWSGSRAVAWPRWPALIRCHWGAENNCHHTFDAEFREDESLWIEMEANGTLAVLLLRRVAYNLLTLFRIVTQRSAEPRQESWKNLMRWAYHALIAATNKDLAGLPLRKTIIDVTEYFRAPPQARRRHRVARRCRRHLVVQAAVVSAATGSIHEKRSGVIVKDLCEACPKMNRFTPIFNHLQIRR